MKLLPIILSMLFLTGSLSAITAGQHDYDFQQERMLLTSDAIFIISSFENEDHVTAYSYYGERLWDNAFHAKVVSWELKDRYVFVFSKSRKGYTTYLTCLDIYTGIVIWQKP